MEQSNDDATTLLKTLLERFNSLERDVTEFKERQARRNPSAAGSPGTEVPMSTADDEKAGDTPEGRRATSQSSSMGKSRGVRQPDPREMSEKPRRSRSPRQGRRRRCETHSVEGLEPMNTPRRRKGESPSRWHHRWWADPMSDSEEPEAMDYTTESESGEQTHTSVTEVSGRTEKFLQKKCTRRVPTPERRDIHEKYPLPEVPATKPAQLDPMLKSEISPATKTADRQLTKVQARLLDSLAPMTSLLEAHNKGNKLDQKDVIQAVKMGVTLIGNANAHLLHLRRERIVSDINTALLPIVGDDSNFREAAPLLFGTEFAKKGKEMVEQVKAIQSTLDKKPEWKPPFFRGGPSSRGGLQHTIRKGRSPDIPIQIQGEAIPGGQRPISDTEKDSKVVPVSVDHHTLITQIAHVGVRPQTQPDSLPPAGRLKGHLDTWKVITSDLWVAATIQGYRIDFLSEPHQRVRPHTPQYSVEQSQLIVEEIKERLGKGAITEVHNPRGGFYSNLFLVPKKDGGQRPVINLKALNSFVQTGHFKMEGIHTLRDLVNPEDSMAKVDLKDTYFTIPIHKSHHQ